VLIKLKFTSMIWLIMVMARMLSITELWLWCWSLVTN